MLTYEELVSLTSKQSLQICQYLKLQKHLKELKETKKELGSFCQSDPDSTLDEESSH